MKMFLVVQCEDRDWMAVRFADGDATFKGTREEAFSWVQANTDIPTDAERLARIEHRWGTWSLRDKKPESR